jgi:LPXTG-motif cell wall-anchored protein
MEVVAAEIPVFGTMLAIAGIALLLGIIALWLARRRTRKDHRERHERESEQPPPVG